MLKQTILLTGGTGFIGSHTALLLLEAGFQVVVLDNLCNSSAKSLDSIAQLAGASPIFIQGDVRDRALLENVFTRHDIAGVIHFAGLKAVGESVQKPLSYYENNIAGTALLCQTMAHAGVFRMVFSSSATVYGDPVTVPLREDMATGFPTSPYGRSKLMIEQILRDLAASDSRWSVALLRYFNPVGAHPSGLLGEDPKGVPNNLLPYITQVAIGKLPQLSVFGDDYPTPDGTGVRDYIHVMDLADGHLKALSALSGKTGTYTWNLGSGRGYSVLELVRAFEAASGRSIPYRIAPRRAGDIAQCWADPAKAERELGWRAQRGLGEIMRDAWNWQVKFPNGFSA